MPPRRHWKTRKEDKQRFVSNDSPISVGRVLCSYCGKYHRVGSAVFFRHTSNQKTQKKLQYYVDKYGRRHKVRTWIHKPTGQLGYVVDIKDPWGEKIHGLDVELIDPLLTIWSKGWRTSSACSGHTGRDSIPGISLRLRSPEDEKVIGDWWEGFNKTKLNKQWELERATLWGKHYLEGLSNKDYALYQQDIQTIADSLPQNKEMDMTVERWKSDLVASRRDKPEIVNKGTEKLEERSYKEKGTWYVYFVDKEGNQVAPAGTAHHKHEARAWAENNIRQRRY